jgi:hypothetical protein
MAVLPYAVIILYLPPHSSLIQFFNPTLTHHNQVYEFFRKVYQS